ncbi:hypothetical protein KP509_20G085400 [Ceratopteris richardii]|nr:hypothetical protein KP509_20G085400 [Ceratopteris richardii]
MGNSFFKEKKYVQAIECYSRSIALQPSAVSYANRAMAYIKIRRFKEAEADCTEAIGFDDRYVKAYSRRSTSRKELGDFLGAVSDAEFALRLEPENKELKEQYIHAKALCEKMMNVKPDEKKIPVPIEELRATSNINGSSDAKAHHMYKEESSLHPSPMPREQYPKHDEGAGKNGKVVFSAEAVAASIAAARAATQAKLTAPNNFYEFEAVWKGFTSNPLQQAELLKVIKPSTLPHMFKDNLSPKLLGEILRALELLFPENASHAVDILESLTLSKRFGITAMCLSSKEKKELQRLWEEVFSVSQFDEEKMHVLDRLRPKFLV